jgi:hypothetical protein
MLEIVHAFLGCVQGAYIAHGADEVVDGAGLDPAQMRLEF